MKAIICYYSGSGNTKLACTYIKEKIQSIQFELFDIVNDAGVNFNDYDIFIFATFADAWGVSKKFTDFITQFSGANKYCFVFNTYGCISGKCLPIMKKLAAHQGFRVLGGHSLHCPENYPPMIASGNAFENSPSTEELRQFNEFVSALDESISSILKNQPAGNIKMDINLIDRILPRWVAKVYGSVSGKEFFFNEKLCILCSKCVLVCPYKAITLNSNTPAIQKDKCQACWACYNHCPKKAVFTKKYHGEEQYSKPNQHLKNSLK